MLDVTKRGGLVGTWLKRPRVGLFIGQMRETISVDCTQEASAEVESLKSFQMMMIIGRYTMQASLCVMVLPA